MSKDIKKDYTDEILKNNVIARFESHGERFEIIISPGAIEGIRDGGPLNMGILQASLFFPMRKRVTKHQKKRWMKCLIPTQ